MTRLALRPCPHCGSHLTEADPEGDLHCITCARTVADPSRTPSMIVVRNRRRRRPYTANLTDREKARLYTVCGASRCSVNELVYLWLADAGPLPADDLDERIAASITVYLSDHELDKLSGLGGGMQVSSLVRRLIRWGLPRLEREYGLERGGTPNLSTGGRIAS